MTYDEIIAALPTLSLDQLEDLRKRIAALKSTAPDRKWVAIEDDYLLQSIMEYLRATGYGHTIPPNFRIKDKSAYKSYSEKSLRVRAFLEEACPNMTKNERFTLARLAVKCLNMYLREFSEPVACSLETMLVFVDKIPAAIDAQFPRYVEAGLLPFLIRK